MHCLCKYVRMVSVQLCLKTFHQAVAKLRPSTTRGSADQSKMASVLKSVLDMLAKKEGKHQKGIVQWENKSIYIVAESFTFGKHLHKVLQMGNAANVHFIMFESQPAQVALLLQYRAI